MTAVALVDKSVSTALSADYNMFLPNIPGFAAAIFTTVSCYALASMQVRLQLQAAGVVPMQQCFMHSM